MPTKIKPQRVEANNTPTAGQVPSFVSDTQFSWITPSGGGGISTVFLASNTGNDYSITGTGIGSYSEVNGVLIRVDNQNTGSITLNIDGLGVKNVVTVNGNPLNANILNQNATYLVRYESSIDKLVISSSADINLQPLINGDFVDFPGLDFGGQTYALPGMNNSNGMIYDGNRYLYISNQVGNSIAKFDTFTNTQVSTLAFGGQPRHNIDLFGGFLYVTSYNTGQLKRIDLSTFTITGTVGVGANPFGVRVDATGAFAYVTNEGSNNVSKINLSTFTNVGTLSVGTLPRGITINSGFAYVCNGTSNNVSKINLSTFTVAATLGGFNSPRGISILSGFAYVTNDGTTTVSKVNLGTFTITGSVTVGTNPQGITIDLNTNTAYIANNGSSNVSVINLSTFTTTGTFSVGNGPQETVIVGNYLYVANQISNNLSRVSLLNIGNPAAGYFRLFFKSDGKLYRKDSAGAEQLIGTQT